MPRYIHPHSLVPWEWLYHATIYPPPLSSSMGVIISCHDISTPLSSCMGMTMIIIMLWCIYTPHKIWDWLWGHYTFTPDKIWWGGEYIVMSYCHSQHYLEGDIIFSPLTIFSEGVNISWHYIFTPGNIWWGGDYIVTYFHSDNIWSGGDYIVTYFHSWRYLVRGWLYRDITLSFVTLR